jgi:hypothetical protein
MEEEVQLFKMLGMGGGVEQQIVNVHNHVGQAMDHGFCESLEAGRCPKESHWGGDPLVLPLSGHDESSVGLT